MPSTAAETAPCSRALIAVIDGNDERRTQYGQALRSFYPVYGFHDLKTAMSELGRVRPSLLVVDEKVMAPPKANLLTMLQGAFGKTPVIACTSSGQQAVRANLVWSEIADVRLEKPFRRSQLVGAISGLLNRNVEESWNALPVPHASTLRRTLATFNGIADLIDSGEPLAYQQIVECCTPVVDAVTASQYKPLLAGVRDHDNYAYVHSLRVATLLALFGDTIGLKDEALLILATGGLLHDIGKMSLPQEITGKPSALTALEMAQMRQHVHATVNYLRKHSDVPKGVLTIAAQHHERLDGSGYPGKLAGSQLNDLARMSAIVDVFSAMTERRPYKNPVTPEQAFEVMTTEMADKLDQRLLLMFKDMLMESVVWV
ncbi:MAG: HD domain-containing phosphohydrolase [Solirubrobacterales bacterium]